MKIDNMSLEGKGREKSQETNVKSEQNHNKRYVMVPVGARYTIIPVFEHTK